LSTKGDIAVKKKTLNVVLVLVAVCVISGCGAQQGSVKNILAEELPALGHRNWILIVDSAYPAQSRPAIRTVTTTADQIELVQTVLKEIDSTDHITPHIYLDAELKYVSEDDAPGINNYRSELTEALVGRSVKSIPHEELIQQVDKAAQTFRVLILKTPLTLPYTSVFLELDCGYWSPQKEKRMRQAIEEAK
jgi:L-fucose mutarotase/ribose pyranase (RbsD/FucU family)